MTTLARLRELEANATAAPWGDRGVLVYTPPGNPYGSQIATTYGDNAEANTTFIAEFRNVFPLLLAVAEAADDLRVYEPGRAGDAAARARLFAAVDALLAETP